MSRVQKAIEITDAKIQFVSLVDKAANKRQFLVTKAENGQAHFASEGKIVKVDEDTHYITGIVYEPMTEDAHGNFMTAEEITKAAYWFAKNGDSVDLQHSFENAAGLTVVENYIAPSDLTIGNTPVMKGAWVITVECTDSAVWDAVQKGELTGFSMGGVGNYSEEDTNLTTVSKNDSEMAEKKGLLKRLGEFFGLDIIEKGEVLDRYNESTKSSAFWNAMWALEDVLYRYDWSSDRYVFLSDESAVREALEDFSKIITSILSDTSLPIIKAVELPVIKAGKRMSGANKAKLDEICQALSDFKTSFEENEEAAEEDAGESITKKEETDMTRVETEALVNEVVGQAITKALAEAGITKSESEQPVQKTETETMTPEQIDTAVEKAVKKALVAAGLAEAETEANAPVTKADVEGIVQKALEPMLKAFRLPSNLNDKGEAIEKSDDGHYLHGIL